MRPGQKEVFSEPPLPFYNPHLCLYFLCGITVLRMSTPAVLPQSYNRHNSLEVWISHLYLETISTTPILKKFLASGYALSLYQQDRKLTVGPANTVRDSLHFFFQTNHPGLSAFVCPQTDIFLAGILFHSSHFLFHISCGIH